VSRAFVKEDGPEPSEDPPERPVSPLPNYVTRRGLRRLEAAEEALLAEHATLPPGSPDPAARRRRKVVERDLRYLRARLQAAIPVDVSAGPRDAVRFGARVALARADGEGRTLRIVGEDEAEEGGELAPWSGPFVQALFGLKPGAELDWDGGAGAERWRVVSVEFPD
jgi:transcription elongation GreA/GreB family factor